MMKVDTHFSFFRLISINILFKRKFLANHLTDSFRLNGHIPSLWFLLPAFYCVHNNSCRAATGRVG